MAQGQGAGNAFPTTSLFVGDLDVNVTDSQLYDLFNQMCQAVPVRVCRDLTTRRSLGYGYLNYSTPFDAAKALEVLNFTPLNYKLIKVMYSQRDPSVRKSGAGNIFIKNLGTSFLAKLLPMLLVNPGDMDLCNMMLRKLPRKP